MASDGWNVGDVPKPLIEVLHPVTKERLLAAAAPDVTIVAPDGSRSTVVADHDSEVIGAWTTDIELTQVGPYVGIVESPAPYKDVQTFSLYANPVP